MSVAITGIGGGGHNEERAWLSLQVEHNGQTYDWGIFIPVDNTMDLPTFLQSKEAEIYADIDRKEAEWAALSPKTREQFDVMTQENILVDIAKHEIVHPENPDYYAKRRTEYPPLANQLDAIWKGGESMTAMANLINSIKQKYPKP